MPDTEQDVAAVVIAAGIPRERRGEVYLALLRYCQHHARPPTRGLAWRICRRRAIDQFRREHGRSGWRRFVALDEAVPAHASADAADAVADLDQGAEEPAPPPAPAPETAAELARALARPNTWAKALALAREIAARRNGRLLT